MGDLFETGATVAQGRYRIEGLLGGGGMAQVYRAHDERLARTVALKAMRADLPHDPGWTARFRREAQAMAALSHPNVVAVHDTGEEPGPGGGAPVPFIVMELIPGRSLADHLRERGPLPVAEALDLAAQMLAALAAAHARGLVHRDIKPANVLLTGDGTAKVADFGIAATAETGATALTRTGTAIGTPPYMSPEQVEGQRGVDGRSDLYSLGIVLFQMLAGRVPFEADSGYAIGYLHVHAEPPTLASAGIGVPAPVQGLLTTALAKRPEDRFPDAATMRAAALAAARSHPPTDVVRISALAVEPTRPVRAAPPPEGSLQGALRGALRTLGTRPRPSRKTVKFLLLVLSYLLGWLIVSLTFSGGHPPVRVNLALGLAGIACVWFGGANRRRRITGPITLLYELLTAVAWLFHVVAVLISGIYLLAKP
ncbi:serine/threonine protein kinase [Streptomyces sp. NBC_00536]|uniref:serine/threonine-protein kinase n=1 Tax=Streptomyces sp. NBC_00536 TaxID=2975769 RepID=UPI002E80DC1E|nr:serine/threonine-protein kinase [Streptomyces sp. NBC_00536]WUC80804.1 serine/threonine protein kinase [Streptomyces sp. NBC_00536]